MKKKILIHSNNTKAFTGFGKHTKNIMRYLQATNKYEIIGFANGTTWGDPQMDLRPWKAQGSLPNDRATINDLKTNPEKSRAAAYGCEMIDQAIKEYKPDIYLGIEDIWGFTNYWKKPWWNKINHMIWTTLDSQPILPLAMEAARETKSFHVWASFAERDMVKAGQGHVKTLHGTVNTEDFNRFTEEDRKRLRSRFGSAVVGGLRAFVRSVSAKVGSGLRLMFASVEVSVVFINIAQRVFLSALFLVFCEAK